MMGTTIDSNISKLSSAFIGREIDNTEDNIMTMHYL